VREAPRASSARLAITAPHALVYCAGCNSAAASGCAAKYAASTTSAAAA
jgi:hypothetical protein